MEEIKYWLCTKRGKKLSAKSDEKYAEVFPQVGMLAKTTANSKPVTTHSDDVWKEISEEEYTKKYKGINKNN